MDFSIDKYDTVFFDLDGTLLGLSDEAFEGIYTKLISKRFKDLIEPEKFIKVLWEGTEAMMAHEDPSRHVLETFFETFTEKTGISKEETRKRFDAFYRNEFGQLQEVCDPVPEARKIIDRLKAEGKQVVLATNPVFPEIATRKRCKWTNLDFDDFEYVSHAENSFACKPNPDYYSRLLKLVKTIPERTLMVGNDYLFDMAASELGIDTWMIDRYRGNVKYKGNFKIDYNGSLKLLLDLI